jgi:hypothetical protein
MSATPKATSSEQQFPLLQPTRSRARSPVGHPSSGGLHCFVVDWRIILLCQDQQRRSQVSPSLENPMTCGHSVRSWAAYARAPAGGLDRRRPLSRMLWNEDAMDETGGESFQRGSGTRLTYYEAFDSVVVGGQSTPDVVSSLKLELLRGKRIALSDNQAFDSQMIHGCFEDPAFRVLLMRGDIVVVTRPEAPSVARALQDALARSGFRFSYHQELNDDVNLRKATLAALTARDPMRAGKLALYVEDVLTLDSVLALAPRRHVDPAFPKDAFAKLLAGVAATEQDKSVQQLLSAGNCDRSDVYTKLDGLLDHGLSVDDCTRVRRLVDACYCLVVACSIHADTLVVRPGWPSEVAPDLLGLTEPRRVQEVAAAERAESLKRALDTDVSGATSLSWQAIVDFLERAPVPVGAIADDERERYRHAARFFALRSVEQGGLRPRTVLLSKIAGAVAGGLAWSIPAFLVVQLSGQTLSAAWTAALSGLLPGALFGYAALEALVVKWIIAHRTRKISPLLEDQPL